MRVSCCFAISTASMAVAAVWLALPAQGQENGANRLKLDVGLAETGDQPPLPDAAPAEGDVPGARGAAVDPNEKDARLTVKDIQRLRRQHVPLDQIVDNVAEQGRAFEVTADVARQLRRLGFRPAQIDAIKEAATEPLVPGKSLTDDDEEKLTQEWRKFVMGRK